MQAGHMKRPLTLYIKVNEESDGNARNMAHNILFDKLCTMASRSLNVDMIIYTKKISNNNFKTPLI